MNYLEKKYINIISNRLLGFKWSGINQAIFRCPICGDSKKSSKKKRGSFFVYKSVTFFGCHNCGNPKPFDKFLYYFDQGLWQEFRLECLKDKSGINNKNIIEVERELDKNSTDPILFKSLKTIPESTDNFFGIKKVLSLPVTHPVKKYIKKRKLDNFQDELYYVSNFPAWVSETFDHMKQWKNVDKHPRLIFPCYGKNNEILGFTARALLSNNVRYCHVKLCDDDEFLYGMNKIDSTKRVKIVEGNVDSLMIDNAIAVMGSNLNSINIFTDAVYIYDNQPRNKEICRLLNKTIVDGKNVVIWPDNFKFKDLNDAIVSNLHNKESLEKIIAENTFCGIIAQVKFNQWKKI